MFDSLQHLLAEQTTPLELIYFIITVCALAIAGAAVIYAAVMSILWTARLRPMVPYPRVFLPTRAHFKAFLPEYLLAFATTAVLTLTIAVKHDIVDAVLAYDADDIPAADVARLLPLGAPPVGNELGDFDEEAAELGALLRDEARTSTRVTALAVLKPFLEAGRAGEVRRVVGLIVDDVTESTRMETALLRGLLVGSVVMILAYLAWLAWGRFKTLRASPDAPVTYEDTFRRVAMMGIALALLLASRGMVGEELIGDSAVGAIRHEEPDEALAPGLARAIGFAVDYQHAMHRPLRAFEGIEDVDSVSALLAGLGTRLRATEDGLAATGIRVATTADSVGLLSTGWRARGLLVDELLGELRSLRDAFAAERERSANRDREVEALRRESERLAPLVQALDGYGPALADLRRSAAASDRAIAALGQRYAGLAEALDAVRARQDGWELLLVSTSGGYTVAGGRARPDSGESLGLHWLPTGVPHVVRTPAGSAEVSLRPGEPRAVSLFPPRITGAGVTPRRDGDRPIP